MAEQNKGSGGKKAAGVGAAALIIALLFGAGNGFGLGGGAGIGAGDGAGTKSQAVTAESVSSGSEKTESAVSESAAEESKTSESTAGEKNELVIRVHNMEVYVDETLCGDDEAVLKAVEEKLKDGVVLILQDDYADNEAFSSVEKLLDKESYEYRTETKK